MIKIIDGKKIALEIRNEISKEVQIMLSNNIQPRLVVVLVGENPASQVYVRMKEKACLDVRISSETIRLSHSIIQDQLIDLILKLNQDPSIHGILVQLPLPNHIDENKVIEVIDPSKDVDGIHPINMGRLASGIEDGFIPCTPAGIVELLLRSGYSPDGKHVVIVGRSNLVSKPVGLLLLQKKKGRNATITFCHSQTQNLSNITQMADILIVAAGSPGLIKKDMVRPGVVVIDVGTNRVEDPSVEKGYRIVGDVLFSEVSSIAEAISPVPGGVGPMTIALLLKNTIKACKNRKE